jgi:hypothetical protein
VKLDFTRFHPLDHWPGTLRCRQLPGGTRNHLTLAWQYKWSRQLAAVTLCAIGRHRWLTGRRYLNRGTPHETSVPTRTCFNCYKTCPERDSNPCYRLEGPASSTTKRPGP